MWSKLVRLNALACTTSAYDKLLGEIRSTPELRADLVGAIEEACRRRARRGRPTWTPASAIDELERAHDTLGSSMQRDIAAGRTPELDAIPGSVLRAAARHGLRCPTIERLVDDDRRARRDRAAASLARRLRPRAERAGAGAAARARTGRPARRAPGAIAGSDWRAIASTTCSSASLSSSSCSPSQSTRKLPVTPLSTWIVMPGRISSPSSKPEALQVEVREADAVGGVGRVLAVVRGDRLREALEVLGDLARVRHRSAGQPTAAAGGTRDRWRGVRSRAWCSTVHRRQVLRRAARPVDALAHPCGTAAVALDKAGTPTSSKVKGGR